MHFRTFHALIITLYLSNAKFLANSENAPFFCRHILAVHGMLAELSSNFNAVKVLAVIVIGW